MTGAPRAAVAIVDTTGMSHRDAVFWNCVNATNAHLGSIDRTVETTGSAFDDACARIRTAVPLAFEALVDERARRYANDPKLLDSIEEGLSSLSPTDLVKRIDELRRKAEQDPLPRHYGMGGESSDISLRAARREGERRLAFTQAAE